jgi:mannose/fructose/N-acetylgalactosamine-specific phosphotransferase system component IID
MLKMLFGVLPIAALVAVVFWTVFVFKYEKEDDKSAANPKAQEYLDKSTVSFQAVVATILVYFVSHHGLDQLLSVSGRV